MNIAKKMEIIWLKFPFNKNQEKKFLTHSLQPYSIKSSPHTQCQPNNSSSGTWVCRVRWEIII